MGSSRRRVLGVVQTYESFHDIIIKEKQRENTVDDWLDYRTAEKGYCTAQDTSSFVTHVAREWVIGANYYTHTRPCLKSWETRSGHETPFKPTWAPTFPHTELEKQTVSSGEQQHGRDVTELHTHTRLQEKLVETLYLPNIYCTVQPLSPL